MTINLSDPDHNKLDQLLVKVLDAYKDDEVSRGAAVGVLAHVIAAAAQDNVSEVKSWIQDPAVYERWKQGVQDA